MTKRTPALDDYTDKWHQTFKDDTNLIETGLVKNGRLTEVANSPYWKYTIESIPSLGGKLTLTSKLRL